MLNSEVRQLELLAAIDDLQRRVVDWSSQTSNWDPMLRCQSLLKRVLQRVEVMRIRMEAPLVVATFGGTGTGKSTLVNALVGEEVTRSGRQRPTTHRPVLIAHHRTELDDLGIPLEEVEVVQRDADLLRDVIILDCPDPDTTEGNTPGSNLDRLRTLLPYCDVLLYVSTQQKYRSARVASELASAASGCRMIFVQTHADLDDDIRDDWRQTLRQEYEVPEVFFVDSLRAMQERQAGHHPTGDMGRLVDLLLNKLGASERIRVRRANVLDLLQAGLVRCQQILFEYQAPLHELNAALAAQQQELSRRMAGQLEEELLASHHLWERRLVSAVTERWGMSPFSAVLRAYNGLGGLIASTALFRVRSAAQLAILGAVQGSRWLEDKRQQQAAESSLQRVSHFGWDDNWLREAEIVIEGHVTTARFRNELFKNHSLDRLRKQAADVEEQFVGDASQYIDEVISDLAGRNSGWWIRGGYEIFLSAFLVFVLFRVGKNFFFDSVFLGQPMLSSDFFLAAGLILLLLCGALVIHFTQRLRRGLTGRIQQLAAKLVEGRLGQGLFPDLEDAVRRATRTGDDVTALLSETSRLRHDFAGIDHLGGRQVQPKALETALDSKPSRNLT